jgi:non-heme chloroperoxidase
MHRRPAIALLLAVAGWLAWTAQARAADRHFVTSDGVRLHYLEAGHGRTLVLIPGWTMPAWIWQRQIDDLARSYRVVAFDPRGQGDSAIPASGYDQDRRGRDIAELLAAIGGDQPVLVGWSLGVLDALAYIHQDGDGGISGLVLIDNSVGEDPPPAPPRHPSRPGPKLSREAWMKSFVRSMFARPQPRAWLDRLTEACLRMPKAAADALLAYPVPRTYWKEAVYSTAKPVLYVVREKFAGQAANLAAHHKDAETVVVKNLGHALFVDDAARFDALLRDFFARRVWPAHR